MGDGSTSSAPGNRLLGIGLALLAMTLFGALDTTAKLLSATVPPAEVAFVRFFGHFWLGWLLVFPPLGPGVRRVLRPGNLKLQLLRSALLAATTLCNFTAVKYLQLADTAALLLTAPLMVTALSVPLLGERVGWRRWTAVLVGFAGAMIIVRPGLGLVHWAAGIALLTAFFGALHQIATRYLAEREPALVTSFWTPVAGMVLILPLALPVWLTPDAALLPLLVATGIFGGAGHLLLVIASRHAPVSVLAPVWFSQALMLILSGWLIFDHLPDLWTAAGGAVVLASALYVVRREARLSAGRG